MVAHKVGWGYTAAACRERARQLAGENQNIRVPKGQVEVQSVRPWLLQLDKLIFNSSINLITANLRRNIDGLVGDEDSSVARARDKLLGQMANDLRAFIIHKSSTKIIQNL